MMKAIDLSIENTVALHIVQALLGLISSSVRAVAFRATKENICLYFLCESGQTFSDDDIEDIQFELDVLTDGKFVIDHEISYVDDIADWSGFDQRLVFRRK